MINAVNIMPTPFIPSSDTIVEHNAHDPKPPDDSDSIKTSPTSNTSSSFNKPFGTPYIPSTNSRNVTIIYYAMKCKSGRELRRRHRVVKDVKEAQTELNPRSITRLSDVVFVIPVGVSFVKLDEVTRVPVSYG